jgi:hypothetical protein
VRKNALEQCIGVEDPLTRGIEATSKQFVEKGAEVYFK